MEDEVVRIAKKMDKMVQKKNAVSAAGGADRQAGWRARAAGDGRGGPPAGQWGLRASFRRLPVREAGVDCTRVLGEAVRVGGHRR